MSDEIILEVRGLSKSFGGVKAVDDVSFKLHKGETLGIIGPNGSGKTTLVNLITGFVEKDSGHVFFKGKDISKLPPHKIADIGIGRTFQIMRPYPSLPAYKNLIVPLFSPRVRRTVHGKLGDRDAVAIDILEDIGFEREAYVPYKLASSLPLGYLKRLELGRCLALRADLIIADEVFSGLSMAEIASMIPLVEKLQIEGISVIMIEHRLGELFRVANKVMVLNFGQKIAEDIPSQVMETKEVQQAYFGAALEEEA
jgi:ABC-type branched-subunit amino acid transport system ATPase component